MESEKATRTGLSGKAYGWFDERYKLDDLVEFAKHKTVPIGAHSSVWYYLGGLSMFLFTVQVVTGILILMYYKAGAETSYESMRYLVGQVPFGWLVRSVHCWSAHLMVACVIVHMFSVFFTKAYRKPRELSWLTGFALFGLSLGFGFSGYLLPWNELAFFATSVGTDTVKAIPGIGHWLVAVMRGGDEVTINTLYRFFALHVSILPLIGFAMVGLHLTMIQRQGMAEPMPHRDGEARPRVKRMPFFPNFALRDFLLWTLVLNVIVILAVWRPYGFGIPGAEWELGLKADPLAPAFPGIKPEWYFLWVFQMLREMPPHVLFMEGPQACLLAVLALLGVWALVPFLDRRAVRGERSPGFTDLGCAAIYFVLYLTLKGWDVPIRTAALLTLGFGAVVSVARFFAVRTPYLGLTACALLIPALDAFAPLGTYPYLRAGLIATGALVLVLGVTFLRGRKRATGALGAALLAAMMLGGVATANAKAAPPAAPAPPPPPAASAPTAPAKAPPAGELTKDETLQELLEAAGPEARTEYATLSAHTRRLVERAVSEVELLSSANQLKTLLGLRLADEKLELVLQNNCILCHSNDEILDPKEDDKIFFRATRKQADPYHHLSLQEVAADVHFQRGLSCVGCHGGDAGATEMSPDIYQRWPKASVRKRDRTWVPKFCGGCHSDPGLMRRYKPSLPVDQLLKYRDSMHGKLLLGPAKDSKAAQCVSCHGVHGIRTPESPLSLVYSRNVPRTCGRCHADAAYMKGYTMLDGKTPLPTDQLVQWKQSVHGKAMLEKGDLAAPVCNDCHGNHASMPPSTAHIAQVCRNCHVNNGELFDGSSHKQAFEKHGWPECETCHGKHEIRRLTDKALEQRPGALCYSCHAKFGKPECNEAVDHFRTEVHDLRDLKHGIVGQIEQAERYGMETHDLRFGLAAIDDGLVEVRSKMHSFDRSTVDKVLKKTKTAGELLQEKATRRVNEYGIRKKGLLVSILLITVFAALLLLKIRAVDKETGYER